MEEPVAPASIDGRRQRGDRSRAIILAEAVAIASVDGVEALTMGRVATAAGVPKSSLQMLFKDRQSLQIETLRRGAETFEAEILRSVKPAASPLATLLALIDAWFDVVERKVLPGGCLVTAAVAEFRLRYGALHEAIELHRAKWRALLLGHVEAAQSNGSLTSDVDADDLVFEIMALQSAANAALAPGAHQDVDRAKRRIRQRIDELRV